MLLFPEDPTECFEFGAQAFDLADRLQTPVFVMLDLDIGMKDWLTEPFAWDDAQPDRPRQGDDARPTSRPGNDFGRYLDVDGDGIPYRTYPGTHPTRARYFTRGTTKDRYARYTEDGADYVDNMQRLLRKFETAKALVPGPVIAARRASRRAAGVIYFGSTARAMDEALAQLEREGIHLDRMRVRAFPVRRRGRRFHRRARARVRRRAEPRRAAAHAARQRVRDRPGAAGLGAALRRHADHRALHHPRDRREGAVVRLRTCAPRAPPNRASDCP